MISYDILIKSFVTIKNLALMVDIGVLSLAAMDHGPHTKIMSYQTFFLEKWQSNGDYVAMSENVLFPNLH